MLRLSRRVLGFGSLVAAACASALAAAACGSAEAVRLAPDDAPDASIHREGGPVEPPPPGDYDGGDPAAPAPSCEDYCDAVTENCTGAHAQYTSREECLAICGDLPEGSAGETDSNTVACRLSYAGGPSKTMPSKYCPIAGPFGGGACGDRCTAFCLVALAACAPDGGSTAPYTSYPECQTACAGFEFRESGVDGGGEGPDGPTSGDTLNCRLYHLREATVDPAACPELGADSDACR